MSWEIPFVILLLVLALASFILEKIPTDLTALAVVSILLVVQNLTGSTALPNLEDTFKVFTNPAPITIAAMFIISAAVQNCGAVEGISAVFERATRYGYHVFLCLMMLTIAAVSGFVNNTPVVVILLPVIISLAKKINQPASKLLIPLSYASILGGTCTLLGTSTNILASGIIVELGQEPLSMFELGKVGLPLLGVGILYLVLFGKRILPLRETLTSMLSEEERKEFITEAFVRADAEIIGKTVKEAGLAGKRGIRLLEIVRHDISLYIDPTKTTLQAGDRLILKCRPSGVAEARGIKGVHLTSETEQGGIEEIHAEEGTLVEAVISPNSAILGRTLQEVNFRQRFRATVMAVHRQGRNVGQNLHKLFLRPGDTLLLLGTQDAIENLRSSSDILLIDRPPTPAQSLRKKLPIVYSVMAGVILASTFNIMPIAASTIIGVTILYLAGCMKTKEGYAAIDLSLLILIYGMLVLGTALQKSGATDMVANSLTHLADILPFEDPSLSAMLMLAVCYLSTAILTELLSNNATVVVMTPISLGLAQSLGVDPRPFIICTCIAASASFCTPIGYQTNTYVYSVGGYRFSDFIKVGLPMAILYFAGSLFLIPRIWPF